MCMYILHIVFCRNSNVIPCSSGLGPLGAAKAANKEILKNNVEFRALQSIRRISLGPRPCSGVPSILFASLAPLSSPVALVFDLCAL